MKTQSKYETCSLKDSVGLMREDGCVWEYNTPNTSRNALLLSDPEFTKALLDFTELRPVRLAQDEPVTSENREFISCHLTEATHYFNPATSTYHRRKCTSVHVGSGRNISTEMARDIGWKPVLMIQPEAQMPKHRDMIILANPNGSSVVVRRFDRNESYDAVQYRRGLIFPDTPAGLKAARKKAGVEG